MSIEWFGEGCFKITETGNRFSVLTEPPIRESGLPTPRHKTDVVLNIFSDLSDSLFNQKKKDAFVISNAGDYELKNVFIQGIILNFNKNRAKTAYKIKMEGISVGYLGMMNNKEITLEIGNFLSDLDIMIIPIGGGEVLDAEGAVGLIKQVEPNIIIPMYYKIPGLKIKRGDLENFLKKMEVKSTEQLEKLMVKTKDLESWDEETKVVVLKHL